MSQQDLRSPQRQWLALRQEHADLDASIDLLSASPGVDELLLMRLKKRRLALRDQIAQLEQLLDPKEPA